MNKILKQTNMNTRLCMEFDVCPISMHADGHFDRFIVNPPKGTKNNHQI